MHYFQLEFEAHERQEELLHEARERRLGRTLKSNRWNNGVPSRLHVLRLVGLLRRGPGYEVGLDAFDEDGKVVPCPAECTKTADTTT